MCQSVQPLDEPLNVQIGQDQCQITQGDTTRDENSLPEELQQNKVRNKVPDLPFLLRIATRLAYVYELDGFR